MLGNAPVAEALTVSPKRVEVRGIVAEYSLLHPRIALRAGFKREIDNARVFIRLCVARSSRGAHLWTSTDLAVRSAQKINRRAHAY